MIAWECYGYVRPHYPVLGNFLKFKSIFQSFIRQISSL